MPLNLPAPRKDRLARSPLALAVCQIRYEQLPPASSDSRNILSVHQALGGRAGKYPIAETFDLAAVNIQVGSTIPQAVLPQPQRGWRLRSEDGRWTITLMPDHVALETTRYTTWDGDFRPRLAALLDAVAEHLKPTIEQRIGLRYVNRITEPRVDSAQELRDLIVPELLGPALHQGFGDAVVAAQQQLDLDIGDGIRCGVRHGFFRDDDREGAVTYLLDFDVYRQGAQAFDVDDLKKSAEAFNTLALQLFQQSVTERLLTYLGSDNG